MKKKLVSLALISMLAALTIPMSVSAIYLEGEENVSNSDEPHIMLAETLPDELDTDEQTEGPEVEIDPETGYVYEDGVNVTVQGDIMLLSDEEDEAPPVQSVPKTGVRSAGAGVAAAGLGVAVLACFRKIRNR